MKINNFYKVLITILLLIGTVFFIKDLDIQRYMNNPEIIVNYIKSFGLLAPIVFIVLFILRTLLFIFPVGIFAVIGSSVFGIIPGFIYSITGALLSATLAFSIGRYFEKHIVEKYLTHQVRVLKDKSHKGFKIILLLRLVMLPFDILGYIAGATRVIYKDFILATAVGIIPEFLLYAYIGEKLIANITIEKKIGIIIAITIIIAIAVYIKKKLYISKYYSNEHDKGL